MLGSDGSWSSWWARRVGTSLSVIGDFIITFTLHIHWGNINQAISFSCRWIFFASAVPFPSDKLGQCWTRNFKHNAILKLPKKLCPFCCPLCKGSGERQRRVSIVSSIIIWRWVAASVLARHIFYPGTLMRGTLPASVGYYQFLPGCCCCCCCSAIMCLNYKLNTAVTTAGCWPGLAGSYRHNRKMLNYIVRWPVLRIYSRISTISTHIIYEVSSMFNSAVFPDTWWGWHNRAIWPYCSS